MRWFWLFAIACLYIGCRDDSSIATKDASAETSPIEPASTADLICPSSDAPGQLARKKVAFRPMIMPWHASDSGDLELAAWPDPSLPSMWCAIRNAGKHDVRYCNYTLGYFESVRVFARQKATSKWQEIPRREKLRLFVSAGPGRGNFQSLGAGQEMTPSRHNDWLRNLPGPKFTLYVDFEDFQWPKGWRDKVEVYVTQTLSDFGAKDTWSGTLKSKPVVVDLKRLRPHAR